MPLKALTASVLSLPLGLVALHPGVAQLPESKNTAAHIRILSSETETLLRSQGRLKQPGELNRSAAGRCVPETTSQLTGTYAQTTEAVANFKPRQVMALANSTNYGKRLSKDIYGKPVNNPWIVVLHETVSSGSATIRFFQTPHYRESEQASYHALIMRDGTLVYLVPSDKRAFGAGNSVFMGPNGPEAVKTHPKFPPSVNNFAYHISLETPADGNNNHATHSGYTRAQYQSLAWLVAQTKVSDSRITTHKAIDRSGERQDPRSFNSQVFLAMLHAYQRTNQVVHTCSPGPAA